MSILLSITDIVIINHFLNQFLYSREGVHLLGLRKGFGLAYISSESRLMDLLNVLFLFI